LEELQLNRVTHSVIDIQKKNYIASGVIFSYGQSEYRLCLLTNRDALLNNNVFLEAKTEIITLFVILLVLMMLISMGFAQRVWGLQMRRDANEELITSLNHSVNRLNDHLEKTDLFDIKHQLWEKRALKTFVKKLRGRQVSPLVLAEVEFETEDVRPMFLIRASMLLDQSVLRFGEKKGSILLLFLKCNIDDARFAIHPLLNSVVRLKRLLVLSDGDEAIKSILTERELE
jgi:hypothetical protein